MNTMTKAAADVLAERGRQVESEGWTPEHDDGHKFGELAIAASCYADWPHPEGGRCAGRWPWDHHWWKPKDRRTDLVRAAALLLAEIERLDRAAAAPKWKPCKRCHNPTYCREGVGGCDLDEMAR